jgi:UDP-glucose 4-epimerase
MKYLVTGGAGFIGSHLVDRLLADGHTVTIIDNLLSGSKKNIHPCATLIQTDIRNFDKIQEYFKDCDGVFHLAALARTPWCIDDPALCYEINVMGTLNVLEAVRKYKVPRIVLTSSNVVYAFYTPYRTSKEALEGLARTYKDMYGVSTICLRNSNVYGQRQSERGPSPNVFAALRKSKKENGFLLLTGDGEQTRDYTHVSDIVEGHILAMKSMKSGTYDLCTGINHTLNKVASYFDCPVRYTAERPGDMKHIYQDPSAAEVTLGFRAKIQLDEGIKDFLQDTSYD